MIPLFIPSPTPQHELGAVRTATDPAGAHLSVTTLSQTRDEQDRTQTTVLRYERTSAAEVVVEDRPWLIHWHTPGSITQLARAAGLVVRSIKDPKGRAAADDLDEFTVYVQTESG